MLWLSHTVVRIASRHAFYSRQPHLFAVEYESVTLYAEITEANMTTFNITNPIVVKHAHFKGVKRWIVKVPWMDFPAVLSDAG